MRDAALTYHVFLSHSAKDKAVVRAMPKPSRKGGLQVWFDEWVLNTGDSIPTKIEEGLEHSRVLVLCMSANAFGSDPDRSGLEAGTCGRGILPFRDRLNKERPFLSGLQTSAFIRQPLPVAPHHRLDAAVKPLELILWL